jgi:hypothetical protein
MLRRRKVKRATTALGLREEDGAFIFNFFARFAGYFFKINKAGA